MIIKNLLISDRKRLHPAWVILIICFADHFINFSIHLGYSVILPEMIRDLELNRTAGVTIYNAYLLTYILATPLSGYMTDRYGARSVISICILLLSVGVMSLGAASNFILACIFFSITGIGASGLWVPVITLLQRWFAHERKGLALGILSTGSGLGLAVMGVVVPFFVNNFTWRYGWYFIGIIGLILVWPNAIFLRSDPAEKSARPWGIKKNYNAPMFIKSGKVPIYSILIDKNFWVIGFSYFCLSYGLYGFTTFMVDYAAYQIKMPSEQANLLATIHGLFQTVGVLSVMPISDYLGRKKTIILSNSIIATLLTLILYYGTSSVAMYIFTAGIGIFYGATFPIYGACAGDYFSRNAIGTVAGAWTLFFGSGTMLTHWITGILRDKTGIYDSGLMICAIMATFSIILITFVRKRD